MLMVDECRTIASNTSTERLSASLQSKYHGGQNDCKFNSWRIKSGILTNKKKRENINAFGAGTNGDVLNLHTEGVFVHTHTGEEGGCRRQVCLPKFAHVGLSRGAREVHQRNNRILHIFTLRISREQHVLESSNHLLCPIKLFSFSYPEGDAGGNQR